MSALEKGLVTVLAGTVAAYPRLPQPVTYPLVRYQRIITSRTNSIDGLNVGVTEVGMQVDCMSDSYDGAKTLADSVRTLLHTYVGSWGTLTAHFVNLQTENDFYEQDGDRKTHWVAQRYQIWTDME
jgi:hypothetical protein